MNIRGACVLAMGCLAVAGLGAGCSSDSDGGDQSGGRAPVVAGSPSQEGGRGGAPMVSLGGATTGGSSVMLPNAGRGGGPDFEECAGELVGGKRVPLDMYIMLDTSGSMLEMTDAGDEKWASVKDAVTAFISDQGSAGMSVGIQYFPLRKPGVPESCTSNDQCGADGGPCFLKLCWGAPPVVGLVPCNTTADCDFGDLGSFGECVSFGFCELDTTYVCRTLGGQCTDETGRNIGRCLPPESTCLNATRCDTEAYAAPAVAIGELPRAADALVDSIESQDPRGQTPTGPAIRGAIQYAQDWAESHPGRAVVTVLATDGMPTECEPTEIPEIADLARAGSQSEPPIRTFVIGVFGPTDPNARQNLDAIARSGGTESAFIVDTSRDVTAQFLEALNAIRGSQLGCEFQIPAPTSGNDLDYGLVNVQLTSEGKTTDLFFVGDAEADCDAAGGWYYDADPAVADPTRIIMCPSTCEAIQAAADASVDIQLGCTMRVR